MSATVSSLVIAVIAIAFRRYLKPLLIIAGIAFILPVINSITGGAVADTVGGIFTTIGAPAEVANLIDSAISYGAMFAKNLA